MLSSLKSKVRLFPCLLIGANSCRIPARVIGELLFPNQDMILPQYPEALALKVLSKLSAMILRILPSRLQGQQFSHELFAQALGQELVYETLGTIRGTGNRFDGSLALCWTCR